MQLRPTLFNVRLKARKVRVHVVRYPYARLTYTFRIIKKNLGIFATHRSPYRHTQA
jgi:hypothetical protein